jgi:hypothetical protein
MQGAVAADPATACLDDSTVVACAPPRLGNGGVRDLDPAPAVSPPLSLCLFVCAAVVSCTDGLQLLPRLRWRRI